MTTRGQARSGASDLQARRTVAADPAPGLPRKLVAARERKGVDLARAERDTKIRARYLDALEQGDWRALPGTVYTKGFLRNYALYLGLDPDEVIREWRHDRGDAREAEPITVPRAITAPRRGLTFSTGILWAALLTAGVAAFAIYLGVQLLRFARPPTLEILDPPVAVSTVDETTTSYTLRGRSIAGATISIKTPGRERPYLVSAGPDGTWSALVDLRRGRNQFDLTATDPETGKSAERVEQLFITVPFLVIEAPTLTVDQPAEDATYENGAIPVQGVARNADRVEISAAYLGPTGEGAAPASSPAASRSPKPSPKPSPTPRVPKPVSVTLGDDGTFAAPVELTAGRWALTVSAFSKSGKTTSLRRDVTVAYEGVNLVVGVRGGRAWLRIWVDEKPYPLERCPNELCADGETISLTGRTSIEVRTGSAGNTHFTLNGRSLGALGEIGVAETWRFEPPDPPRKTKRS
ncbi:MAG TPA: helix-turn-helix domain-containing protein [Candidatus Limnocylindrales bacterium]|jgi:cytoskeletal protein RodZ